VRRREPALVTNRPPDGGGSPAARPRSPGGGPERKLGRNDPCWCGSGKKYKKCHGREA